MDIFDYSEMPTSKVSNRLEIALRNVEFARRYTKSLLIDLAEEDWYWVPNGGSDDFATHIAWQVGHLAMAEYGLLLFRQRGRDRDIDKGLMSSSFRKLFMRGTAPTPNRDDYPPTAEILETLDKVHAQCLKEASEFDDASLDEPLDAPHAAYSSRYGALLFAADHEMIHAGQIGLLRRLMGKSPLR